MSWDIFVQDIPSAARRIDDIPSDFQPQPLASRSEILRRLKEIVPDADFSDPAWVTFDGPDFSVEFNIGDDGDVDGFAMHIRGGDAAAGFVADVLTRGGWRAFDPASESGIFDPATAAEGLRRWRKFRDHATKQTGTAET